MRSKIIYLTILIFLILSLTLEAQQKQFKKLDLIEQNCYQSLVHENRGVSESAIFISIQFKHRFPNRNDDKFIEALEELMNNSDSPIISYKAQLARLYFKSNELFTDIAVNSIYEEQKVYGEIADKINRIILAGNFD